MDKKYLLTVHCLDCSQVLYEPYRWIREDKPRPGESAPLCDCKDMPKYITSYESDETDAHTEKGQVWISNQIPPILDWFTPLLAAEEWGLKENTIHVHLKRGKFDEYVKRGLVRRSKATWLIHREALEQVYDEKKK